MPNEYSDAWFRCFRDSIDPDQTRREVDFLACQIPVAHYRNVVDLCCGLGGHACLLAARGYWVTGVDCNATALAAAREAGPPDVTYNEADMRDSDAIPLGTDAVLCMWQSFGHFDETTNRQVLANIAGRLPVGGRFVPAAAAFFGFFRGFWGKRSTDDAGPSAPPQIATESTEPTEIPPATHPTLLCPSLHLLIRKPSKCHRRANLHWVAWGKSYRRRGW